MIPTYISQIVVVATGTGAGTGTARQPADGHDPLTSHPGGTGARRDPWAEEHPQPPWVRGPSMSPGHVGGHLPPPPASPLPGKIAPFAPACGQTASRPPVRPPRPDRAFPDPAALPSGSADVDPRLDPQSDQTDRQDLNDLFRGRFLLSLPPSPPYDARVVMRTEEIRYSLRGLYPRA